MRRQAKKKFIQIFGKILLKDLPSFKIPGRCVCPFIRKSNIKTGIIMKTKI